MDEKRRTLWVRRFLLKIWRVDGDRYPLSNCLGNTKSRKWFHYFLDSNPYAEKYSKSYLYQVFCKMV